MNKITNDEYREEAARCQVNCMVKVQQGMEILDKVVRTHPRSLKIEEEMKQIQKEVKNLNQEILKANSFNNYSV